MLSEMRNVRQIEGEGIRRWFTDSFFDLIVWYGDEGDLVGFQVCYDKLGSERSVTWRRGHGTQHDKVDGGECPGHLPMTPVMVSDGSVPRARIAERFRRESSRIDHEITRLVLAVLAPSSEGSVHGGAFQASAAEKGR